MIKSKAIIFGFCVISFCAYSQEIQTTQKNFAIELSSSRVIFYGDKKSSSVSVLNPQSFPVLVQSVSLKEDLKTPGSYIITPPLFRLEAQQRSNILVRLMSKENFPEDRESMEWMCVKAVPPKDDDISTRAPASPEVILQLSLNTCNKVFYRPKTITESPISFYSGLVWTIKDGHYFVKNEGPFYINFADVKHNGKSVSGFDIIPPFTEKKFNRSNSMKGEIKWKVVTDTGGISSDYKTVL